MRNDSMPALTRRDNRVEVVERPIPTPMPHQVLVRVFAAGVCRTDVQVARGQLACANPVVLGHELAGEVVALGQEAPAECMGVAVSAVPWRGSQWLGVHIDGAFARYICVHHEQIVQLSPKLSWREGAYVEPVAAALGAVLTQGVGERVLVLGSGRIAVLTKRVLEACTGSVVTVATGLPQDSENHWDTVVEAAPVADVLISALRAVRPRGQVILKSRADVHLQLPLQLAIAKGASLHPVGHGCFDRAAALLAGGQVRVHDLLGPTLPLADWQTAFQMGESTKVFLEA